MKKNNVEQHNAKYRIGAVMKSGAKVLDILRYSKNGRATLFLWKCPCGNTYEGKATRRLCPLCVSASMKEVKRHVGIYAIKSGNNIYIGESLNIEKRWRQHNDDLQNGKHHNKKLQELYNNGAQLQFEIVYATAYIPDHKLAFKFFNLEQEHKYIDQYCDAGYNVLNKEDSVAKMQSFKNLNQFYDIFKSLNISMYNDIIGLPNEKSEQWSEFKRTYYNKYGKKIT